MKYNAKPCTHFGIRFASKYEGEIYLMLKDMQTRKQIDSLECHPRYPLNVGGEKIGDYVCDFRFREKGKEVALEAKGHAGDTRLWKWKERHFRAQYRNVELRVVKPGQLLKARAA